MDPHPPYKTTSALALRYKSTETTLATQEVALSSHTVKTSTGREVAPDYTVFTATGLMTDRCALPCLCISFNLG